MWLHGLHHLGPFGAWNNVLNIYRTFIYCLEPTLGGITAGTYYRLPHVEYRMPSNHASMVTCR